MKENMLLIKTVVRPNSENQIPNIKTLSITIHDINVIHRLKNSEDSLRIACPSPISH